jgi:hypothetical protein
MNLSEITQNDLGCWIAGSTVNTAAEFSVAIVELARKCGMELEVKIWEEDVPKFLDGTADIDALEDLGGITDAAMDFMTSQLPEDYYFAFDDGLYLYKDDKTCACMCGCEVPLSGGTCVDCGDGDHQNNNEEVGICDTCHRPYELASREGRCGDCGDCSTCCEHA